MPKKITQNVNKDKLLNDLPKVKPNLTTWLNKHTNYQSCNMGQIVPILCEEILPNEEKEITMGMISHTTTPIAPIFPSMYTEIRSFFVPDRLCVDLLNGYSTRKSPFVKVFGEDNKSASSDIIVPLDAQKLPEFTTSHTFITSLVNYFNLGRKDSVFDSLDLYKPSPFASDLVKMNFLSLAAYELIYQRHYRNENFEAATDSLLYRYLFNGYDVNKSAVSLSATFQFEMANREKDYFTGLKPFTQKGDPVTVGLVGNAPVKTGSVNTQLVTTSGTNSYVLKSGTTPLIYGTDSDPNQVGTYEMTLNSGTIKTGYVGAKYTGSTGSNPKDVAPINLYADLASVNGISIEQLRLLIKTQELLEKDAIYGSLYAESLNAHFGCCPLDLTLQDPQELYKVTITSHMQAIFQTSSTSGEASILGTIGANSTTQTDPFVILPKTKFKEHGILMICAVHKMQNVYDSAFFKPRFNFKQERFDFYTPELEDLGYQSLLDGEAPILVGGGFNEAFAEYRYVFNKVHGRLASEFPYWAPAISNEYASVATLYKEDKTIIDKALSVQSSSAPQFYDAWGFEEKNTKPMKLHSIPGFDGVI